MKLLIILTMLLSVLYSCPDEDEYCVFCSGKGKTECLLCLGSYNIEGECVPSKIIDPYCLSYASEGYCHTCVKGYYSFIGKCIPNPIKNCLVFDPQTGKCHVCRDNRMPYNNSCTSGQMTPCFISTNICIYYYVGIYSFYL